MKYTTRRQLLSGAAQYAVTGTLAATLGTAAFAQPETWPNPATPIKMIIPFGPGSGTDVYARMLAQQLSSGLGSPVVVDNRPGANGVLAAETAAHARPDGYTILLTTNTTHAANPNLVKALRYDPVKDFTPISKAGTLTFFVLVSAASPYMTMDQLVAAARRQPKTISYGASNSLGIVSGSKLAKTANVEMIGVNYKSSPQAVTDLLGGTISLAFVDMAAAGPLITSGKVRALAVLADKRFAPLPNVPTMKEAGFGDFNVVAWFGLFAPAGTPPAIVARLNRELNLVVNKPDVKERSASLGLDVFGSSPEELGDYVVSQIQLWAKLTADAGLKPE